MTGNITQVLLLRILALVNLLGLLPLVSIRAELDPEVKNAPIWDCYKDKGKRVVWRAKIGSKAGPVAFAGENVMVGTDVYKGDMRTHKFIEYGGAMMCFNSQTGEFLWQATHLQLPLRVNDMQGSINSRAWVAGRRAWYISNRGELVCVDTEGFSDGKNDGPYTAEELTGPNDADFIWKLDMVRELGVFKRDAYDAWSTMCSPVVLGDLVFCVTGEGCRPLDQPGSAPSFIAVNKESGKVVWSSRAPGKAIMYSQWSSPVIARVQGKDQIVFPGGDGWLYGFEPKTGKLIWKVNCNDRSLRDWRLDPSGGHATGDVKHFFVGTPTVHKDTIFVGLNNDFEDPQTNAPLYAISLGHHGDASAKAVRWKFQHPDFGSTYSSPAVADGIVYVVGDRAVLFALNEKNGKEIWHCRFADDSGSYGSPIIANGKVFVGTDDGESVVLATGRQKKCLGRFELLRPIYHSPVVVKDCFYIAAGDYLWKLHLPE